MEGVEHPTVPAWLRERLKMNTQVVEEPKEDDMTNFLVRLKQTIVKKPTTRFSTIRQSYNTDCSA